MAILKLYRLRRGGFRGEIHQRYERLHRDGLDLALSLSLAGPPRFGTDIQDIHHMNRRLNEVYRC